MPLAGLRQPWSSSPMFGTGELVVIGVILLIVFSTSRMGSLGNAVGKFVYSFRKASRGADLVDVTPSSVEVRDVTPPPRPPEA